MDIGTLNTWWKINQDRNGKPTGINKNSNGRTHQGMLWVSTSTGKR